MAQVMGGNPMYTDNIAIKDIRPGLKNINVVFIVLEVGVATVTKENREVRTFKVGDPTACINVSVWDEPGKLLVPGDIVRLTKGYASVWRQCLTLYSGKSGDINKVGDFCMIFNEQLNMSEPCPTAAMAPGNAALLMNNGTGGAGVQQGPNNGGGGIQSRLGAQAPNNSVGSGAQPTNKPGGGPGLIRGLSSGDLGNNKPGLAASPASNAAVSSPAASGLATSGGAAGAAVKGNARSRNNQTRGNLKNDRR